ncbi:MAG: 8-oxo-dGTP diphosphatase [Acidimicrobiaceae bacterium]|jgi:8-oxo-dGTP pyrophosphatase MutT (NUDIX family)
MQQRKAVRALLVDESGAVLLMQVVEPVTRKAVWIAPGGGVDDGESALMTLRRELLEELGYSLAVEHEPVAVWTRHHEFTWAGTAIDQHETYFLIRCVQFVPERCVEGVPGAMFDCDHRWWTPDDIEHSADTFAPRSLGTALRTLIENRPPPSPIDVGV